MASEILGKGWKFPLVIGQIPLQQGSDPVFSFMSSDHEENIKDSIKLILSTAKGERVMRPDFGCGIHDYVFQVINTTNISLMKSSVAEALRTFEPRIEVLNVSVDVSDVGTGVVNIGIEYRVIQTNNQFNLVYPFYLTEGA